MKPTIYECVEPGLISEKEACWPSSFAIVKKYPILYAEHLKWFKKHISKRIYGLPFDNTPDKFYRGADREGTSVYGLYNSEFRSKRSALEEQTITRLLENDNELSIVADEADAVLLHGLLQKRDEYELIHARPVGSSDDYPENYHFMGYDICYPVDCSGGFSIICDCMFICKWHGCDTDGTRFLEDFNKLNEYGLFDTVDDAYRYMVKYLNEDWSEKGRYCIYEIREKEGDRQSSFLSKDIDMELLDGRPVNTAGRLPREIRTYDLLDSLGIEYKRTDHERTDTMEACNAVDKILGVVICKNLFLCNRQKTAFYLLMMPGDKKFKTKELSAQIGSARLSFAGPEEMLKYLDIEPGSVSIMGLMNDNDHAVKLLIDEDVLKDDYLGCHPCVNTSSIKLRTEDVIKKFLPAVGHNYKTVHLIGED